VFEAGNADLWMLEPARGVLTRLTTSPRLEFLARWTPDGRRLAFVGEDRVFDLYWMPADGSAPPELLRTSDYDKYPGSWSPDGRAFLYTETHTTTRENIWLLDVTGSKEARPLIVTPFLESGPEFSPDGRWFAFMSNESGRVEVYIAPLANPSAKTRISTAGGTEPSWAPDGRRLFYRSGDRLMSVDLGTGPAPAPGEARPLFAAETIADGWQSFRNYDPAADGRRFVIVDQGGAGATPIPLHVILNWFTDLDRRLPAARR